MNKLLATAAFLSIMSTSALANASKYLVVDIEHVIYNSNAMTQVKKEVEAYRDKNQKDIESKEKELKAEEDKLKAEQSTLAADAFQKKVRDFQTKVAEMQRNIQLKRSKMEEAYAGALAQMNQEAAKIIADVAKENGADLILPTSQVLYAEDSMNKSEEVLKRVNDKVKKVKIELK